MTNAINAAPINYSADSKIPGQLPYLITSQFLFVITGYLIYVGLARMLSEESFGVYGVVIGVFTVINMVINLGIQQTVSKFVSEDTEHSYLIMKRLFKMIFIFSLVIMVLLFLTAPIIAYLFYKFTLFKAKSTKLCSLKDVNNNGANAMPHRELLRSKSGLPAVDVVNIF